MNEAILKWLASGTIGMVVCCSLWLAGNVQHEVAPASLLSQRAAPSQPPAPTNAEELHLAAARNAAHAGAAVSARTPVEVN